MGEGASGAYGRAELVAKHVKSATAAALAKARRQFAYHATQLDKRRAALRTRAIGEHDALDAERRTVLRDMSDAERTQAVLTDAAFRQAALRGGKGLSGISPEVCERALEIAIRENALEVAAALAVAEEAQSVHQGALRVLERELLTTPFMELAKADAASPDASVGHRPKLALALAHRPVLARRVTWVTLIGSNFTIT